MSSSWVLCFLFKENLIRGNFNRDSFYRRWRISAVRHTHRHQVDLWLEWPLIPLQFLRAVPRRLISFHGELTSLFSSWIQFAWSSVHRVSLVVAEPRAWKLDLLVQKETKISLHHGLLRSRWWIRTVVHSLLG